MWDIIISFKEQGAVVANMKERQFSTQWIRQRCLLIYVFNVWRILGYIAFTELLIICIVFIAWNSINIPKYPSPCVVSLTFLLLTRYQK